MNNPCSISHAVVMHMEHEDCIFNGVYRIADAKIGIEPELLDKSMAELE